MSDDVEAMLASDVARFAHDPLGFVRYVFPWGQVELSEHTGPRDWQAEVMREIGDRLRSGVDRRRVMSEAIQIAVSSGHGIGKSALVSWLILWAMSTREDTRGVVTANTESQLRTKTWAELAKWHRLSLNKHWFTITATALFSSDPKHEKTWRIDAIPWSESRPEAFAGLHNQGSRILVVFDEASAIPDIIWEVVEGALTDEDTEIIWAAFGNPTRNTGRFRECFGRYRHRWSGRHIDSRTVQGTNKPQLDRWVEDYGEDSDFVRVRVRGQFPRAGSMQFIATDLVEKAADEKQTPELFNHTDPLIVGVDVARFGDDASTIVFRRGRDARSIPIRKFYGVDGMTLAGELATIITEMNPDAVFIDETGGYGGGPIDRLRQLGFEVIGVNFARRADSKVDGVEAANKRAEMWMLMRKWLSEGGAIPNDPELIADLTGIEYGYDAKNRVILEKKSDMKARGLSSPDVADGLALTFAYPVPPRDVARRRVEGVAMAVTEYDPLE